MPHITTHQENISSHQVSIPQWAPNHHGWSLWLTAKPAAPHRYSRWLTGLSQSHNRCCQGQPGMRVAHHLLAPHQLIFVENCRQALRRCAVAHYQTTSVLTLHNEKEHRHSGVSFHSKETTTCQVDEPQLKKITNQSAVIACHAEKTTHLWRRSGLVIPRSLEVCQGLSKCPAHTTWHKNERAHKGVYTCEGWASAQPREDNLTRSEVIRHGPRVGEIDDSW